MFKMTPSAKGELLDILASPGMKGMMPMVTWGDKIDGTEGGEWAIGFYAKADLEAFPKEVVEDRLCMIDGVEFIVDGPAKYGPLLSVSTLSLTNGKFVFV